MSSLALYITAPSVLYKMGPAAPEVHLTIVVIVYLHLVWSSSTRFFSEDGFMELAPVHE
jgi:hypothetical protein